MLRHLEEAIGTHDDSLTAIVNPASATKVSFHLADPVLHSAAPPADKRRKMPVKEELDRNQLLAHLPVDEKRALCTQLQLVSLRTKEEIIGV
jgi:hypothetical protein